MVWETKCYILFLFWVLANFYTKVQHLMYQQPLHNPQQVLLRLSMHRSAIHPLNLRGICNLSSIRRCKPSTLTRCLSMALLPRERKNWKGTKLTWIRFSLDSCNEAGKTLNVTSSPIVSNYEFNGTTYSYIIEWSSTGCLESEPNQNAWLPLGGQGPDCSTLLINNYKDCKYSGFFVFKAWLILLSGANGGTGGSIKAGCIEYSFRPLSSLSPAVWLGKKPLGKTMCLRKWPEKSVKSHWHSRWIVLLSTPWGQIDKKHCLLIGNRAKL